jgi:hypothetical protein
MDQQSLITLGVFLGLVLAFINAMLTKEVLMWIPSRRKQALLIVLVWVVPLIGAVIVYRSAELTWFQKSKDDPGGGSSVAGGLLGLDSFFNPGARHTLETMQAEHVEVSESGEPEHNVSQDEAPSVSQPGKEGPN